MSAPRTVCLKAAHLRATASASDVKEWLRDEHNVYTGRSQRIFVHWKRPLGDGESMPEGSYLDKQGCVVERFVLPESIWHNPYKVEKGKPFDEEINRVLKQYEAYLRDRLCREPDLVRQLKRLSGKMLGCWCTDLSKCHTSVIVALYHEL